MKQICQRCGKISDTRVITNTNAGHDMRKVYKITPSFTFRGRPASPPKTPFEWSSFECCLSCQHDLAIRLVEELEKELTSPK